MHETFNSKPPRLNYHCSISLGRIIVSWISVHLNPCSANFTKWSNTLKEFVGKLPTNCLSVFNHFVELALKESRATQTLDILIIFKKNVLPDVRFEIRLVRPNIISTWKHYIQEWMNVNQTIKSLSNLLGQLQLLHFLVRLLHR